MAGLHRISLRHRAPLDTPPESLGVMLPVSIHMDSLNNVMFANSSFVALLCDFE
jgi:hypothetical protein